MVAYAGMEHALTVRACDLYAYKLQAPLGDRPTFDIAGLVAGLDMEVCKEKCPQNGKCSDLGNGCRCIYVRSGPPKYQPRLHYVRCNRFGSYMSDCGHMSRACCRWSLHLCCLRAVRAQQGTGVLAYAWM